MARRGNDPQRSLRQRRAHDLSTSVLGGLPPVLIPTQTGANDWFRWATIYGLFNDDRVEDAFELAQEVGIGHHGERLVFFKMLQAEAITAAKSKFEPISDWLSLEYCPDDLRLPLELVVPRTLAACDRAASRMEWEHEVPTVVTILSIEADNGMRLGYEAPKTEYEKICLAADTVESPMYDTVVAHEYGHVIAENLSASRIPLWVSEGVAMWVADQIESPQPFVTRQWPWLSVKDLEATFRSTFSPYGAEIVAREAAYQQAGRVVQAINDLMPIQEWLRRFQSERFLDGLLDRIFSRSPAEALSRRFLSSSLEDLFAQAIPK